MEGDTQVLQKFLVYIHINWIWGFGRISTVPLLCCNCFRFASSASPTFGGLAQTGGTPTFGGMSQGDSGFGGFGGGGGGGGGGGFGASPSTFNSYSNENKN